MRAVRTNQTAGTAATRPRRTARARLVAVGAAGLLLLAACGSGSVGGEIGEPIGDVPPATQQSATVSDEPTIDEPTEDTPSLTDPSEPPADDGTGADTDSPGAGTSSIATDGSTQTDQPGATAAATALEAADTGFVVSIDGDEDGGTWEVEIAAADGSTVEYVISADGTEVVAGPFADDDDADDRAETAAEVDAASLDAVAAIAAIAAARPGLVTDIDLDTSNGVVVWEADVYPGDGTEYEVTIDAATGEVLRNKLDD